MEGIEGISGIEGIQFLELVGGVAPDTLELLILKGVIKLFIRRLLALAVFISAILLHHLDLFFGESKSAANPIPNKKS